MDSTRMLTGPVTFHVSYVTCRHCCSLLVNTLNAELNCTCYLLALLGAHHILHVGRIIIILIIIISIQGWAI
jgi:hypothetical protein